MLQKKSKYQSKVYRDFKTLDKRNFHAIVRFYEGHLQKIKQLRFEESFVMLLYYGTALFEVGQYEKQLKVADEIIETSIFKNIQYYQGEDIYVKSLFQKAQSLYQLQRFNEAEHILKELIKLAPNQKSYLKLLRQCFYKHGAKYLQHLQSIGVFLLLISAGLLVIDVLVIHNFYPQYSVLSNSICWVGFIGGISFLVLSTFIKHFRIRGRVRKYHQSVLEAKKDH